MALALLLLRLKSDGAQAVTDNGSQIVFCDDAVVFDFARSNRKDVFRSLFIIRSSCIHTRTHNGRIIYIYICAFQINKKTFTIRTVIPLKIRKIFGKRVRSEGLASWLENDFEQVDDAQYTTRRFSYRRAVILSTNLSVLENVFFPLSHYDHLTHHYNTSWEIKNVFLPKVFIIIVLSL